MPKRVVDGEGLWRSDKLARLEPVWCRAEYANILPLALANGSFECNPQRVWSIVYSYNRPDMTPEKVSLCLQAFEEVKLLFRWADPDGKAWGYFPGIEKPGRLPGQSRKGKNEKVGAIPPADALRKFLDSKNFPGFGSGSGLGSGTGESGKAQTLSSEPPAPGVCEQTIALWNAERGTLPETQKLTQGRRRKILARTRSDSQFLDKFANAVRKARVTPFLCGSGELILPHPDRASGQGSTTPIALGRRYRLNLLERERNDGNNNRKSLRKRGLT